MAKKLFRYLGLVLGAFVCLPIFIDAWAYFVSVDGKSESTTYKLFEEFGKIETTALGDHYQAIWFTLFKVLTIVALVLAVVTLLVYVLDDLKVLKLQKGEKVLSGLLVVVGVLMLITLLLTTLINKNVVELFNVKTVYGFGGAIGAWLACAFAVVGGALALYGVAKPKTKKRK